MEGRVTVEDNPDIMEVLALESGEGMNVDDVLDLGTLQTKKVGGRCDGHGGF